MVAFLIAITSFRRIEELHPSQSRTLHLDSQRQVHSQNQSKVPPRSGFHFPPQSIELLVFSLQSNSGAERALHTLEVKCALMYYIERTKPFHRFDQLFLVFSKPYNVHPISKASITKLIVGCIHTYYNKAKRALLITAGVLCTCKKAATIAFLGNIQTVLRTLFQTSALPTL